jgi:hypothetical protein
MKKITIKEVPAVKARPAKTKEVIHTMCDICSLEIKSHGRVCVLCKRDVHYYNWKKTTQCMADDDREYGDYPDTYCIKCHDLKFGKYNQEYMDAVREFDELEESIEVRVRKESLGDESVISRH